MTVSSQTNKLRAVGNGVASAFPLPFRFYANSEISAIFVERATGVTTPAVIGTDYTLTGAGDPEVNGSATGVLTTTVPLAATRDLIIIRTLPTIQATDIVNQGEFFASTHEDVFDRLTMIDQQQAEELSRCVKTSVSDTITPDQLLDSIRQSEQNAANSAGESAAQAAASAASAAAAAATYDDFDDRYLGAKATDPTIDNDGNPLQTGALYWNTTVGKMKVWGGTAWALWSGDISGPAGSIDTSIMVFDGTSGKLAKSSTAMVNAGGTVISNGVQVGQSGTASNNFHWRNLLDGLLRLSRGNADAPITDVMTVNADNSVEFPGGVASGVLGTGQTWQSVTESRAPAITYTNTTNKPISINVLLLHSAGSVVGSLTVDGMVVDRVTLSNNTSGAYGQLRAIIPPGSTYAISVSTGYYSSWLELR